MTAEKIGFPLFNYTSGYDSRQIEGIEENERPWDITQEVVRYLPVGGVLIDVGCGPARKIIPLDAHAGMIIGIDKQSGVLVKAAINLHTAGTKHTTLVHGYGDSLPIADGLADVVSYMLCPHNAHEAYRIARPGGYVVIERVGERDKQNIKDYFGSDANGVQRGYRSDLPNGAIAALHKKDLLAVGFTEVTSKEGFWKTWYTPDGLLTLLRETPTVKDYDPEQDKIAVDRIIKEQQVDKGIETTQHRVLIVARK